MKNLKADLWYEAIESNQNAVLIDVRTPRECAEGMLPGAQPLDFFNPDTFMTGVEALDKNNTYYVHCRSGNRSLKACRMMEEKGLDVVNLEGGLIALNDLKLV